MKYMLRECYYFFVMLLQRIKFPSVIFEYRSKATIGSVFEGRNKLSHHAFFSGEIGYASYVGANSIISGRIGRYCSIADNVIFLTKTHPVQDAVSTHPSFYSIKKQSGFSYTSTQLFDEQPLLEGSNYSIEIGNDVYIGYGARIVGPCKIGDGAVIAAGAVVTSNVSAYSVVGGVPARLIKKRFSDENIDFLLNLQWWSKSSDWLRDHAMDFRSIDLLKKALKKD